MHPEYLCIICPAALAPFLTIGYIALKKANRVKGPMSGLQRELMQVANDKGQQKDVRQRARQAVEELDSRR